jgi:hypothetical protein
MRYIQIGFHILMVLLVGVALTGGFSPARTGSMMQDSGATIMPTIGVLVLWLAGAVILRLIRRFSS